MINKHFEDDGGRCTTLSNNTIPFRWATWGTLIQTQGAYSIHRKFIWRRQLHPSIRDKVLVVVVAAGGLDYCAMYREATHSIWPWARVTQTKGWTYSARSWPTPSMPSSSPPSSMPSLDEYCAAAMIVREKTHIDLISTSQSHTTQSRHTNV